MTEKIKNFVCLHGHFYQPPRENPWLEEIENQDSAHPYRNWNERITTECYAPNAASRILDDNGNIANIVNNYSKMSFNFGPTLLIWLQRFFPDVHDAIVEADKESLKHFSGHGAAIAQAYNHMILPLCNERDRRTQVIWGIADFEARFHRKPQGMWLPETAVDIASLEILAEMNIKFTILAPRQAKRFRKLDDKHWTVLTDGEIDSQQAYLCHLPSGKSIVLFFYDGSISHDIAFGGLLANGEHFADRIVHSFENSSGPRLMHAATDGETFGHHHRFGNMALSYAYFLLEKNKSVQKTIYAQYLSLHPPLYEVEIHERSSWSCSHGVERWQSDCGCRIASNGWHQKWRAPLREALDWLRDETAVLFEAEMKKNCQDPWAVRDNYIQVVLNRSQLSVEKFLATHCQETLSKAEKINVLKLLELQRHAMFMYTSCGWFFDEVSGIETIQILRYAARVIQLAREISGNDLEPDFLARLELAVGNISEFKNGAEVYRKFVKSSSISLLNVGVHFAILSIFEKFPEMSTVYCYSTRTLVSHEYHVGKHRLLIGRVQIRSLVTWEQADIDFSVLYFGEYNLSGGVRYHQDEEAFRKMQAALHESFSRGDIPEVISLMNADFGQHNYSLWDLFKNEQGKVLNQIFESTMDVIGANFREIYEHYYPLMRIRPDVKIPLPKALAMTVEFVLTRDMTVVLESDPLDLEKLERIAQEIRRWTFTRDKENLGFVAGHRIEKLMAQFYANPHDIDVGRTIATVLRILRTLSLNLDLLKTQNYYFAMLKTIYPAMQIKVENGNVAAQHWVAGFENLGRYLKVAVN